MDDQDGDRKELAKVEPLECDDLSDDGFSVSRSSPGQQVDLAVGMIQMVMDREKETRLRERELHQRYEKALEEERRRLDKEIQYEREDMRRRFEAEERSQLKREERSKEWEEKVIGEVLRREEDLRKREQDFMKQWEIQKTIERLRAFKYETVILSTERTVARLSLKMTEDEKRRRSEGIIDTWIFGIVLFIIFLFVIKTILF